MITVSLVSNARTNSDPIAAPPANATITKPPAKWLLLWSRDRTSDGPSERYSPLIAQAAINEGVNCAKSDLAPGGMPTRGLREPSQPGVLTETSGTVGMTASAITKTAASIQNIRVSGSGPY
jgi:hypothetical protein